MSRRTRTELAATLLAVGVYWYMAKVIVRIAAYGIETDRELETYRAAYGPDAWTVVNPETGSYT